MQQYFVPTCHSVIRLGDFHTSLLFCGVVAKQFTDA